MNSLFKIAVFIPLLFLTGSAQAQYVSGKTNYLVGFQAKILDLAPVAIQFQRASGKLHLSFTAQFWKNEFPNVGGLPPTYKNSNYAYSVDPSFTTLAIKPGIGNIYVQTPQYLAAINFNLPLAYNTYILDYTSEDNLLGKYSKTYVSRKLEMGIEIEQLSRYMLTDRVVVSGGFIVGVVFTEQEVFKEFPSLDAYFDYTPGIGYGEGLYITGYFGLQYLFYGK